MKYFIEQRIWDYIDGNSDPKEQKQVAQLIDSDPEYQAAYQEILGLNNALRQLEMDEPSLSFSRNLMDKVKTEPIPGSIRSLIDKRIVNGLLIFFLTAIAVLLVVAFIQSDWSQPVATSIVSIKIPEINFELPKEIKSWAINGFFFADVVIGLYVLDYYLRKKIKT